MKTMTDEQHSCHVSRTMLRGQCMGNIIISIYDILMLTEIFAREKWSKSALFNWSFSKCSIFIVLIFDSKFLFIFITHVFKLNTCFERDEKFLTYRLKGKLLLQLRWKSNQTNECYRLTKNSHQPKQCRMVSKANAPELLVNRLIKNGCEQNNTKTEMTRIRSDRQKHYTN